MLQTKKKAALASPDCQTRLGLTAMATIVAMALPMAVHAQAVDIVVLNSPHLAVGLGLEVLNPAFVGGTLQMDTPGATYAQNFTISALGGTVDQHGIASTFSGVFSNLVPGTAGALTISNVGSGGSVTYTNANTYTGATTIASGATMALTGTGSIAASSGVASNGTFDIAGTTSGASIVSLSGSGSVALGSQALTLSNAVGTFSGVIGGTDGSLNVAAGTGTLSGVNTYTGATTVASGATLTLSGAGSIAASSGVASNGTFNIAGTTSGASIVSLSGSGSVALGDQTLSLSNAVGTFSGVIGGTDGSLNVAAGTATLTGVNTYTGLTTIDGGATLALSAGNIPQGLLNNGPQLGDGSIAVSSGVISNGIFSIAGTTAGASITTLSGNGSVALGDQTLTLSNAADSFAGVIDGTGGLTVAAGTETLTDANSYTGLTTIDGGATLALSARVLTKFERLNLPSIQIPSIGGSIADSSGVLNNGIFDIAGTTAGASITTLSGNGIVVLGDQTLTLSNAANTFAGVIGGTGGLTVAGGAETLTGVNTYTGLTTIDAGATLALSATIAPSFARINLFNNIAPSGGGSIADSSGVLNNGIFDIAGTTAGASITTLSGNGIVVLGNQTLTLSNAATTFAGVIGGEGGLTVAGGTETLTGINTYTGLTTVGNGATLQVASGDNLGAAGNGLSLNGGTLHTTGSFTSARNMTLTGNAHINTDAGTTLTATGVVSGDGRLYKEGTGALILGGDNIGWIGGTTIDAGLVKVTSATGIGTGEVLLNGGTLETTVTLTTGQRIRVAGNTIVNTDAGTTTTLTGNLESQDSGSNACFIKSGAGTLNLQGNAALSNGACVEQGVLRINGIYSGGLLSVGAGATLRGDGVINAPIIVSGTLAPGNSPGTLTTGSTVTMLSGSTFQADINGLGTGSGPGNYSRLLVTGAGSQFIAGGATLTPNLVNITGADSYTPYVPALGDGFRIVTAEGGIVGRFAPLIQPAGLADETRLVVFYNGDGGNGIDLRLVPTSYASYVRRNGANRNAQSAGAALDNIFEVDQAGAATPTQDRLAFALSSLTAQQIAGAATLLSGEVHATLAAVAPLAGQSLQGTVGRQLNGGLGVLAPDSAAPASNRALWADLVGNRAKWSGDATASGFTANRMQLTVGADPLRTETTRVGAGISHSSANISATAGSGSVDETLVFAYAEHALQHMVFDAMAGYGGSVWKSQRGDPMGIAGSLNDSARGKSGLLSAGVHAASDPNGMQPFARVMWQRTTRDGYNEGSASLAALTLPDYLATGTRVMAGLSGNHTVGEPKTAVHALQYSVALGHDSGDLLRPTVHATLAGADMNILTPQVGRSFVQVNVNGTSRMGKQTQAYYGVSGEFRSGRTDLAITGGARVSF